ncbi:hypothetical protein D3C87_1473690 [compost metagenome]
MWLAHVDDDDIGLFANFERADFIFHADGVGGVDGNHFEYLARRQKVAIVIVQQVLRELRQTGGLEHIEVTAGCRAVGGDGYSNPLGHHFHDRR